MISNLLFNEEGKKIQLNYLKLVIYIKDPNAKQRKALGIIISGRMGNDYNNFSKKLDQKYLHQLLNINLKNEPFKIIEVPRVNLDTKKKDKIFYVEIILDDIPDLFFTKIGKVKKKPINFISYTPISEFPSSTRDFSFSISNLSKVNEVIKILENTSDLIIKNSFMFDFYKNQTNQTVKLGYRFIFQSNFKTLSDDEINNKVEEIIAPIIKLDGVSIPGLEYN